MNVMALEPGTQVDRYVVEGVMGEGGMAMVYRVRHATLDTLHALKIPSMLRPSLRERLIREGKAQAKLSHPNVVPVTDVIDINGAPGLLMQLVPGPSLADWMHAHRAPSDEALALFRGIAAGVGHAHSQGIIHRDLKAANVMLYPRDTGVTPMVTDFGLAKAAAEGDSNTRTGATMGTPTYMAPEQIRDASRVDRRADLYALGVLLYELFTGQVPHATSDLIELYDAIQGRRYTDPRSLRPDIPDEVVHTIHALLSPEPDERPSDVQGIFELLDGRTLEPYAVLPSTPRATELNGAATTLAAGSPGAEHAAELASEASVHRSRSLSTLRSLPDEEAVLDEPAPSKQLHGSTARYTIPALIAVFLVAMVPIFVMVLGSSYWMLFRQVPPPTPPPTTQPITAAPPSKPAPSTEPGTAEPSETPAPTETAPASVPEPAAAPTETPRKPATAPDVATPSEPAQDPGPPSSAPEIATTPVGFLSRPMGATVRVDGRVIGTTPITDHALTDGPHTVELVIDGKRLERQITVGSRYPTRYSWSVSSNAWNALQ